MLLLRREEGLWQAWERERQHELVQQRAASRRISPALLLSVCEQEGTVGLARRLLDPSCALLATLAKRFPFEVAVGVNGLVWVTAEAQGHVNALASAIEASEGAGEEECVELANRCAQQAAAQGSAAHSL